MERNCGESENEEDSLHAVNFHTDIAGDGGGSEEGSLHTDADIVKINTHIFPVAEYIYILLLMT